MIALCLVHLPVIPDEHLDAFGSPFINAKNVHICRNLSKLQTVIRLSSYIVLKGKTEIQPMKTEEHPRKEMFVLIIGLA